MEEQFRDALVELCRETRTVLGRRPSRLIQMMDEDGAVEAVKQLLGSRDVSETFLDLRAINRSDLTVEAFALETRWPAGLFSEAELRVARERLAQ